MAEDPDRIAEYVEVLTGLPVVSAALLVILIFAWSWWKFVVRPILDWRHRDDDK